MTTNYFTLLLTPGEGPDWLGTGLSEKTQVERSGGKGLVINYREGGYKPFASPLLKSGNFLYPRPPPSVRA